MINTGPNWLLLGLTLLIIVALALWLVIRRKPAPVQAVRSVPSAPPLSPEQSLQRALEGNLPDTKADVSPDGKYAVVIHSYEMRMSHWVENGALWDIETSTMITSIGESLWSIGKLIWNGKHGLSVQMIRYPGNVPGGSVALDLDRRTAQLAFGDEALTISLDKLNSWLEDYYTRHSVTDKHSEKKRP